MQKCVYKTAICDSSNLKQRLIDTWTRVSQNIIERAVDQWRKRLRACKMAKGTSVKLSC